MHSLVAQKPAASGTSSTSTGTSTGAAGTAGTLGSTTGTNRNTSGRTTSDTNDLSHPMFLSGTVMFDDGSPANTDVRIERVCAGNSRVESHSDSRGNFSFQVGGSNSYDVSAADASSYGNGAGFGSPGSSSNTFNSSAPRSMTGSGDTGLWDCQLRAAYPGYVSEVVELGGRRSLDDPNVGTIILHRLANVKGTTISVTSALAPKSAQKDYQKGLQLAQKGKFEEAETKLAAATQEYPKYALAWHNLGLVHARLNKPAEATKDFQAAIAADSKYVSPYDQLALLNAQQGNWKEAEKYSKQVIDLNPVEFPAAFWYNAIANYNLKNDAEAEKSAHALAKLDRVHRFPEAERLLATLAANRGDLADAADHLKAYLEEAPNAKGVEQAKQQLARIEEARAAQAKNSSAPALPPQPAPAPPQ